LHVVSDCYQTLMFIRVTKQVNNWYFLPVVEIVIPCGRKT